MVRQYKSEEKPLAIEITHPFKKRWGIRWNFEQKENMWYYVEKEFSTKPSLELIKNTILDWYNQQTDQKILSGFTWKNYPVWLSTENQFNYKAEYDLAVQTGGSTLPAKFKFGTTDAPQYHIFETVEELTDFYIKVVQYIRECLNEGYAKKDAINWEEYEV